MSENVCSITYSIPVYDVVSILVCGMEARIYWVCHLAPLKQFFHVDVDMGLHFINAHETLCLEQVCYLGLDPSIQWQREGCSLEKRLGYKFVWPFDNWFAVSVGGFQNQLEILWNNDTAFVRWRKLYVVSSIHLVHLFPDGLVSRA